MIDDAKFRSLLSAAYALEDRVRHGIERQAELPEFTVDASSTPGSIR